MHDAQVSLDILAGVQAAAQLVGQGGLPETQGAPVSQTELQLDSEDSSVSVLVKEEDAKFNVNILLEPPEGISQDETEAALERLLKAVDEPEGTLPAGLADSVAQYLLDKGSPALTLKELTNVAGLTEELLYGGQEDAGDELDAGFEGLSKYLTVWSDGLINANTADEKVLLSLAEGLNQNTLQMALQSIGKPPQNLPPQMRRLVIEVNRFLKTDGSTYSALAESQSGNYAKRCMAVLRRAGDGVSVILWDELEP
jgi:hypothetical protein